MPFGMNPVAPWHMWGTSETVELSTTGQSYGIARQQLARVNYRRPETWRFMFAARLVDIILANPVTQFCTVDFILIAGVGRSNVVIEDRVLPIGGQGFCRFVFASAGPNPPPGALKWTTTTRTPLLDDTVATSAVDVTTFVADDIQCSARIALNSSPSPSAARVEVYAGFAPNVHVRPEWFDDRNMFRGNETGGT